MDHESHPSDGSGDRSELSGRTVVVTGASVGIGRSLALLFARRGARLALLGRRDDELRRVAAEADAAGGVASTYCVDLAAVDDLRSTARQVEADLGPVTLLINAAGQPLTEPALNVTEEDWDRVVDVGLKALFFTSQAFAPSMIGARRGVIINLSSTDASVAKVGKSVYCAMKAAVSHLTACLALEWAADGIRVNALAPTATATETRPALGDREHARRAAARVPMGRIGDVRDLHGAALFLASDASAFVTGQTIYVDGGMTLGVTKT